MRQKICELVKKEYIPVIVAVLLLILLKMYLVFSISGGPISFGDELFYRKYSLQWFTIGRQKAVHYPPVYPLLLAPSFLFGKNWYIVMKILNIIYSSFVPALVYLIVRIYLDRVKSIYCMLIGCVIPFHFIMPTMILSENVYFPLFLLEIYLVLREYKKWYTGDFLTAFFLVILCLCRYISIVTIPVFFIVWFMKERNGGFRIKELIARGFMILMLMTLFYAPWILMNYQEVPVREIFGFGIADTPAPEQLSIERLLLSAVSYLCYYVLLALPVLPTLFQSIGEISFRNITERYNQLWFMIAGLSGSFLAAVTRHSWRVSYNWPKFTRIMGRYLLYFPLLYILLTFVVWSREKKVSLKREIIIIMFSIPLIILCYYAEIGRTWLHSGANSIFLNFKGAMEGYKFVLLEHKFLAGGILILLVMHLFRHTKWKQYCFLVLFVCMLLYESAGMERYIETMNEYREKKDSEAMEEMNTLLASEFPPMGEQQGITESSRLIPLYFELPAEEVNLSWESNYLNFYGNNRYIRIVKNFDEIEAGEYFYVVTRKTDHYAAETVVKTLGSFKRTDGRAVLLLLKKKDSN